MILSIKGQVAKLYLQGQGLDWGRRCRKWRAELELCSVVPCLIAGSSTDLLQGSDLHGVLSSCTHPYPTRKQDW